MKKFTLIKTALFGIRKAHFSKLRAVLTDMKNNGYKTVAKKLDDTHPGIAKTQRLFKNKKGHGFSFFGTDPDELKSRFTGNKNYFKTASKPILKPIKKPDIKNYLGEIGKNNGTSILGLMNLLKGK